VVGGRYRIDAELGRGGMEAVYRAEHLGLGRPVALEMLHPRLTSDPEVSRHCGRVSTHSLAAKPATPP
jgi:eukaryotic-like serine/threonine-protein kinase